MISLEELKKCRDEIDKKIKETEIENDRLSIESLEKEYLGKVYREDEDVYTTYYLIVGIFGTNKFNCVELFENENEGYSLYTSEKISFFTINDCIEVDREEFDNKLLEVKVFVCDMIDRIK